MAYPIYPVGTVAVATVHGLPAGILRARGEGPKRRPVLVAGTRNGRPLLVVCSTAPMYRSRKLEPYTAEPGSGLRRDGYLWPHLWVPSWAVLAYRVGTAGPDLAGRVLAAHGHELRPQDRRTWEALAVNEEERLADAS